MNTPREVSQQQFDQACAIFDRIAELQDKKRKSGSLQDKLNIQFEISRLIEQRNAILGIA